MRKKVWIIACIGLILIISGVIIECCFSKTSSLEKNSEKKLPSGFSLANIRKIEMCKRKEECGLVDAEFSTLKLNTSVKEISEKIQNINKETEKYYEIANSSIENTSECEGAKKDYQHQFYILTNYQLYQNDEIISIAVNRTIRNLCLNTYETLPYDVLVYDKLAKKVLAVNEVLNSVGYTEEGIKEQIINSIQNTNLVDDTNITMEDVFVNNGEANYSLYYNEDGFLVLAYQVKNADTFDYKEVILGS